MSLLLYLFFAHSQLVYSGFVSFQKPLGYAYKHYSYLLSRKVKRQKKKKELPLPLSLTCTESYSPTVPVRRPTYDSQNNIVGAYGSSQGSLIPDYDNQEIRLSQSPTFPPVYTQEDPSYYAENEPVQRSPRMSFGHQGPRISTNVFSAAQASTSVSADVLKQGKSSLAYNPEMMTYPTLLEKNSLGRSTSSPCIPAIACEYEKTYLLQVALFSLYSLTYLVQASGSSSFPI